MFARALFLLLLTLTACFPLLLTSDWRGTEGRRVQIALEMAASGNWMVPTLGGEPTLAKPPLHYWLLGGVTELFGDQAWALRLPSVLSLFAAALLAMELLRRWFGNAAGWVAALGIICAPLAVFEWATAEIDPIFAALTACSLWCLATGIARDRGSLVVWSGVIGGLAMLQKGPPYFVFAAGAYLVWWRRRGGRFLLHHFVPLLAVPLCYYVPLWLWWISPAEMWSVTQVETIGRISEFQWRHVTETPLFWLRAVLVQVPLVFWCFWEWRGARDARMDAADLTLRMCSGAAVLAIVILTFFPGRPTRYLLPNVPLFVFAVAPAVAHFASQQRVLGGFATGALRVVGVIGAVGLIAMPFLVDRFGLAMAGVLALAGLAWTVVRTPRQLVGFAFLLPVAATWTAGLDRALSYADSARATGPAGVVLRGELEAIGALADLRTYGHVDSKLLLGADLLPPGDEMCLATPTSRWLLSTHDGVREPFPEHYIDRIWLTAGGAVFALHERLPR